MAAKAQEEVKNMMKFVLTGYRYRNMPECLLFPSSLADNQSYPVYDAVYISEDLIFGRDE